MSYFLARFAHSNWFKASENVNLIFGHKSCDLFSGLTYSDKKGIVTGWGVTRESGTVSSKLLEVTIPIMSNKECRSTRYSPERITDNMMCAGYVTGGKDSCQVSGIFFIFFFS